MSPVLSRMICLGAVVFGLLAFPVFAADSPEYAFRVRRAPIAKALYEFAKQAGVSISRPRLSYRDGKTRFMSGKFSIEDGLHQLLRDTDFTFEVVGARSFRVVRKPKHIIRPADMSFSTEMEFFPVQEILVSSLRRVGSLQKLPYSISSVSGSRMEQLGITSTNEVVRHIAGIYATNQGTGQNKVVIRGLSDGAFAGRAQSLVSTYMDNARLTYNAPDPGLKLLDVERIEVLRGPQGTLYGSGALSGLYRVVTRQPNTAETEMQIMSSYAATKYGDPVKKISTIINLPVVDDVIAIRAAAYFEENGGYIDDMRLGLSNVNKSETWGGRFATLFQINENWQVTIGANIQNHDAEDTNYYNGKYGRLIRDNYIQEPRSDAIRQYYATVTADFGWADLTTNISWMRRDIERTLDASLAVPLLVGLDVTPSPFTERRDINIFTSETHLTSKTGDRIEWLVGSFYSVRDERVISSLVVSGASGNVFLENDEVYDEILTDDLTEYALFGEATYFLTEDISVTGGLRWFSYNDMATSSIGDIGVPFRNMVEGTQKKSGVKPKLVLSYHLDDDTLLYWQISQGYRVGGINLSGPNAIDLAAIEAGSAFLPTADTVPANFPDQLANFDSDKLTNFEFGYKRQSPDGTLTVNTAIFYAYWSQIQALEYSLQGLAQVANVGDARIFGAEMDFTFHPHYQFELQGNVSVSNSRITKSTFSFGANVGDPLPGAPSFSAGLSGRYEFDLSNEVSGAVTADYVYVGGANLLFDRVFTPKTDAYHLSNLRVSVYRGQWTATAFVNNIFDTSANSFAFGNPFSLSGDIFFEMADQITPLRPRTVGLEIGWRY